jgi:hypothetical protein
MSQTLSRTWRRFGRWLLALFAVQLGPKMLLTSDYCQHPGTIRERGLMPHVLPMTAGQIGNPVVLFILMISDDRLLHLVLTLVAQAKATVFRTPAPVVGQQKNISSAFPHPGRSFR